MLITQSVFLLTALATFILSFLPLFEFENEEQKTIIILEMRCVCLVIGIVSIVMLLSHFMSKRWENIVKHYLLINCLSYSVTYLVVTILILKWSVTVNYTLPINVFVSALFISQNLMMHNHIMLDLTLRSIWYLVFFTLIQVARLSGSHEANTGIGWLLNQVFYVLMLIAVIGS